LRPFAVTVAGEKKEAKRGTVQTQSTLRDQRTASTSNFYIWRNTMKFLNLIKTFTNDESGAVTVDWVVLTAAIVGLGIAVVVAISGGIGDLGTTITNAVGGTTITGTGGATLGGG